ncbi:hypothetical protein AX14_012178 [Amanita brunnescens Koide BX004]|nr:hypothetical protein AX14_012178 [Amanita brunnescens Koide BX004]
MLSQKPPVDDVQRIPISITASRSMSGEKPDPSRVAHRATSMKYKEKFNAMRQKYEQVTARHEEYQRQLDTANAKIKKLQAENEYVGQYTSTPPLMPILIHSLLLDVISSDTGNLYPYPPPVEPPKPNFHQAPHPYPNPNLPPQAYSGRPHESFPNSYQPPPPPPPQSNSHHHPRPHIQHPHADPHPHPHPHPHHRSPLLIQVNGGGSGSGPPGPGTGPVSGGGARNGFSGISTSHTRTMPMESHERDMVGPAPLPPPPAGPQTLAQAGGRGSTPTPPPSAEYHEPNGRHRLAPGRD